MLGALGPQPLGGRKGRTSFEARITGEAEERETLCDFAYACIWRKVFIRVRLPTAKGKDLGKCHDMEWA